MSPIRSLPSAAQFEKNRLATGKEFIWLYELELPSEPEVTRYRLVRGPESVSFQDKLYSPFPIAHSVDRQDLEGGLPTVSLTVSNVSREIISALEQYDGLVGQPVRIMLTARDLLGLTGEALIDQAFKVISTSANETAVTAQLGDLSLYDTFVPSTRMLKDSCRHQYRGLECGYAVPSANAFYLSTCDKSLDGPNGCVVHGASETDAGMNLVLHPERFGGFPGIPTQTTGGAL